MTNEVVDTLMGLHEGEIVALEAKYYEWSSPFEVASIEEQSWAAPDGSVWVSKHITLDSTSPRGADHEFDVYPAASPPWMGNGYGPLTSVERVSDADDRDEPNVDEADIPNWLERPADGIVDDSPVTRSLEEILDDVERNDTLIDVHKRIAAKSMNATRDLLWQLGLRGQDGRLLDDDVLEVRIGEMREVFVDE